VKCDPLLRRVQPDGGGAGPGGRAAERDSGGAVGAPAGNSLPPRAHGRHAMVRAQLCFLSVWGVYTGGAAEPQRFGTAQRISSSCNKF